MLKKHRFFLLICGIVMSGCYDDFDMQRNEVAGGEERMALSSALAPRNTFYLDARLGRDDNSGTSENAPLQTIGALKNRNITPGSAILFKRGEVWRDTFTTYGNGTADGYITYGAFGDPALPKPAFLGSVSRNRREDWTGAGGNLWTTPLPEAVGNIIFNDGASCGAMIEGGKGNLKSQGAYFIDRGARKIYLYSKQNPALQYNSIEIALCKNIVSLPGKSYIIIENLAFRYGGRHGIQVSGGTDSRKNPLAHHIILRDLEISFIGGGHINDNPGSVRYGNGIEFWSNASDCVVERCLIGQVYDSGVTDQGTGSGTPNYTMRNIAYRNNVIWNCGLASYEHWHYNKIEVVENIRFENNTCLYGGFGWGPITRGTGLTSDHHGYHIAYFGIRAATDDRLVLRNNIFYTSKNDSAHIYWGDDANAPREWLDVVWDANVWYQDPKYGSIIQKWEIITYNGKAGYTANNFSAWQSKPYGKDRHSVCADPKFAGMLPWDRLTTDNLDVGLQPDSPAIGMDAGVLASGSL